MAQSGGILRKPSASSKTGSGTQTKPASAMVKSVSGARKTGKRDSASTVGGQRPPVQTLLVPAKPTQLAQPTQGVAFTMTGKDMVHRIDGSQRIIAIALVPGFTGVSRLDTMTQQYGWSTWTSDPRVSYKSLGALASSGVWYYRVVHDVNPAQLADPGYWNIQSKVFTSQKACVDFEVTIPRAAMTVNKFSSTGTARGSFLLLVHQGEEVDAGEFWLSYSAKMGGTGGYQEVATTYRVENGVFISPESGKKIDGIPATPNSTTYHFVGAPLSRDTAQEFVRLAGGAPRQVVRADHHGIINDQAKVEQITVQHGPQSKLEEASEWIDVIDRSMDLADRVAPKVKRVGRKAKKSVGWIKRRWQALKGGRSTDEESPGSTGDAIELAGPWASFSGHVVVEPGLRARHALADLPSITPLFPASSADGEARFAIGPILGIIGSAVASSVAVEAVGRIIDKVVSSPKLVHRDMDAVAFLHDPRDSPDGAGPGPDGDDNGGIIDPEAPGNPLPEIPDFDDDPEAPHQFVAWRTVNRHFGGYVVDNNGTPVTKWMGCNYAKLAMHLSGPSPKYYENHRMPWDKENKRKLACYVEVDREISGMYLLLHTVNWGDDSCGHWKPSIDGATYFGTVARFGGVSDARSVIRVDDYDRWNKQPVHFYIGQSTHKYRSSDEGRACLFWCSIGAVSDPAIAEKYLQAFHTQGKTAMVNVYVADKGSTFQNGSYESVSDREFRARAISDAPEPTSPGFDKNQEVWLSNQNSRVAGLPRAPLPVAIEDGPIRGMLLARYDDQNGWWQHVPVCALSYTSLSARWKHRWLMGEDGSTAAYRAESSTHGPTMNVLRVTPPATLTPGAFCCLEVHTLNGIGGWRCNVVQRNSTNSIDATRSFQCGPIGCNRFKFNAGEFDLRVVGDDSRPTTAVAAHGGDMYVALSFTCYLVKDHSAAVKWLYFEQDYDDVTTATWASAATKGDNGKYTLPGSNAVVWTQLEKDTGTGVWLPGSTTWTPNPSVDTNLKSNSPLGPGCPLYAQTGMRALKAWNMDVGPVPHADNQVAVEIELDHAGSQA